MAKYFQHKGVRYKIIHSYNEEKWWGNETYWQNVDIGVRDGKYVERRKNFGEWRDRGLKWEYAPARKPSAWDKLWDGLGVSRGVQ